jgi:hypothetical protein
MFLSTVRWIEQRMDGVRCVVFCTTSLRGVMNKCSCLFSILASGFTPRASSYFTVVLIVSISLCSIFPYNLITNSKKL